MMRISEGQFRELHRLVSVANSESSDGAASELVESCCRVKLLYLLFYVIGNEHGDNFFAEAAQTRLQNIKASEGYDGRIHKVHCPPVRNLGEIITIVSRYIAKYGGESIAYCKEIGVFSHSALDGPIGSQPSSVDPTGYNQMSMTGWEKIKFNWWDNEPLFVAYGCNSANELSGKSFAKNLSDLSNFSGVETWGQSTYSYPSFFPDYRYTSGARSTDMGWSVGGTYQVGGNSKEGLVSHIPIYFYPEATPMNCYKNGSVVRSIHQGYFNDHRKVFRLVSVPK